MMVDDNTTSGIEPQSNSTTEVGGTQSRSTASPEEFAQMFAFCLATAIQQSLSPTASQEPMRADQSGMGFPLVMGRRADHAGSGEQADKTDTTTMINTVVPGTPGRALQALWLLRSSKTPSRNSRADYWRNSAQGRGIVARARNHNFRRHGFRRHSSRRSCLRYQRTSRRLKLKPRPKESASLTTSGEWGRRRTKRGPHVATATARSSAQVVSDLRIHAQSARRVLLNLLNRLRRRTSDNARNHYAYKREGP